MHFIFSVPENRVQFELGAVDSRIVTSRNVERILGKTKANFGDIPLSKDVYVAEMCFDDMDSSPYFTIQL